MFLTHEKLTVYTEEIWSRRYEETVEVFPFVSRDAEHRIVLKPPFMDLMWIDVHISADPAEYISEVQVRAEWKQELM